MNRKPGILTFHGILTFAAMVAWPCSTLFAQPYTGNRTGSGPGGPAPDAQRDEGTEFGEIAAVHSYGGQNSSDVGLINIQTDSGMQISVHLTQQTRYVLAGADMDRATVNALLVKKMPVMVHWRYSAETGGKAANSVEVRTVPIQGTIKKANKRQITVAAVPVAREEGYEPVAPPIQAGGRKAHAPPKKAVKKAPAPRTLTLVVQNNFTRISLNDEKADSAAIKPKMTFDAIVIDGGPRWLIELNARTGDGRAAANGDKGGDTEKSDKDGKLKRTNKDKPTDKPKSPQD